MRTLQFEERLYPSIGMFAAISLLSPMVLFAAAPFGWWLALSLAGLTLFSTFLLASVFSPLITVDGQRLLAGRVAIPLAVLGDSEMIPSAELSLELGPKLDARAQRIIRGDIRTAVKIQIADPQDPTPYLIISTRRPQELVRALRANRTEL